MNRRLSEFFWTIPNFDMAPQLTGEGLESPVFSSDDTMMENQQFSLLLYPRGCEKEDEKYISLYLQQLNGDVAENISVICHLRLIDSSGKRNKNTSVTNCKDKPMGCNRFYERSLLLGSLRLELLPGNKLTLSCEIYARPRRRAQRGRKCLGFDPPDLKILSLDFAALLESGVHSDLIIQADGNQFRVHKAVLEARCPTLMSHLVKTKSSDVMALPNIEAPTLQAILHFMYTGIFKSIEKIEDVFADANRFELSGLKRLLFPDSYSTRAKTVIECFRITYDWVLPDFSNFSQSDRDFSYFLMTNNIPESIWMKVSLFAKYRDDGQKGTFLKFQKLQKYSSGAIHLIILVSNGKNELISLKEFENVFQNGEFEIPFDIGMDSVKFLKNDEMKLHFEIKASTGSEQSSVLEVNLSQISELTHSAIENLLGLHYDMYYFYEDLKTGDVTLNIGPHKLTAHKAVLCSRSEVFRKMFQHDSLESQTNSVNIEDVDKETMELLLMYIYSGDACMYEDNYSADKIMKLYSAADKYQLLPIKDKYCEKLKLFIDVENVGDVLLLADAHSEEGLKKHVYEFITANASEILQSQRGLKVLENRGDLYREIITVLLRQVSLQKKRE